MITAGATEMFGCRCGANINIQQEKEQYPWPPSP
jgi:hypothetical protein